VARPEKPVLCLHTEIIILSIRGIVNNPVVPAAEPAVGRLKRGSAVAAGETVQAKLAEDLASR
jgi:hypothetical protein